MALYQELFKALAENHVEYLVAGGFAVNFHNVQRSTVDLDIVLHLNERNILKFIGLMEQIGYQPRLPVHPADFAKPDIRKKWIAEKNMLVFTFYNPKVRFEVIDVFIDEPIPFTDLFQRRLDIQAFGITIPVMGLDDLIQLKMRAGRDKDLFDVDQLKKSREQNEK